MFAAVVFSKGLNILSVLLMKSYDQCKQDFKQSDMLNLLMNYIFFIDLSKILHFFFNLKVNFVGVEYSGEFCFCFRSRSRAGQYAIIICFKIKSGSYFQFSYFYIGFGWTIMRQTHEFVPFQLGISWSGKTHFFIHKA